MAEHVPRWPKRPLSATVWPEGPGQRFVPARVDETDDPFFLSSIPYSSSYERAVYLWLTIWRKDFVEIHKAEVQPWVTGQAEPKGLQERRGGHADSFPAS